MPLHNLVGGEGLAVSGAPSTALMEELNQRKAQVAALDAQLNSSQIASREMENKLGQSQGNLSTAEAKIKELESLLAQKGGGSGNNAASSGGSNDAALKAELSNVTKERDDLRDRLREFEIIADDLANLKRLQQENDQLKKSLAAQGGGKPVAAAPAVQETPKNIISQAEVSDLFEDLGKNEESAAADNSALEDFLSSPTDTESAVDAAFEEAQASMESDETLAAADDSAPESDKPKSEKTPEDLLSEFEKMLG